MGPRYALKMKRRIGWVRHAGEASILLLECTGTQSFRLELVDGSREVGQNESGLRFKLHNESVRWLFFVSVIAIRRIL